MKGAIAPDRCATPDELVRYRTPFHSSTGSPITVTVHRALRPRLKLACKRAARYSRFGERGLVRRVDSFNCRPIRGTVRISNHGRGAAFDIFATDPAIPPPGGVWHPDDTFGRPFAACFTDLGFTWGAMWDREDFPHLEWSGDYVPPLTIRERVRTRALARARYPKGSR